MKFSTMLFVCIVSISLGQTPGPPSLAIGAGKVLYDKGTLDAELISSIIATKQDEIKNELATRLIQDKLANESYVIQHFVKANLDLLLKEKNILIIKKGLLANASELMITSATLEYYLRLHRKNKGPKAFTNIIDDVIKSFVEQSEIEKINRTIFLRGANKQVKNYIKSYSNATLSAIQTDQRKLEAVEKFGVPDQVNKIVHSLTPSEKYLPKPNYIFGFNTLTYITVGDKKIYLQNLLLDLTYGVVTQNEFIQQLGLFSSVAKGSERDQRDSYLHFCSKVDTTSEADLNVILYKNLKQLERCLKTDLQFLTKYQFILSRLNSKQLKKDGQSVVDSTFLSNNVKKIIAAIHSELTAQQFDVTTCKDCDKSVFADLLNLVNSDIIHSDKDDDNWLYTLQLRILPALLNLNVSNKAQHAQLIKAVEDLQNSLQDRLITNLIEDWENLYSRSLKSDILYSLDDLKSTLLRLIHLTVNNFDQAETYEVIMSFITGLGELSSDPSVKAISRTIIDAGEKYITVQKDSNRVSLDVESMAVDVYKQFSENSTRRLSMYFSVGINYNTPIGQKIKINDSTQVKPYSFVSEKIGIKYNIIDCARRYGYFDPSQKRKPIIKDVHGLLFGSGLLYQIKELSTSKNFSSPIAGIGLGATLLNDLDLNINYAFPIDMSVSNALLNVSFDIKIGEYLSALSKAKKQKK